MLKIELIGNLGADAEVKSSNGSEFVTMRVAHTVKYKTQEGQDREQTQWVDVTLNDTSSKIIPYLKQGVKIFVRGNGSTRVYSSPKDRCMKAGLSVAAWEIELVGGSTDEVPRQLVVPETAQLVSVSKHYWVDLDTKKMKKGDMRQLLDQKGHVYLMDSTGFVHVPAPEVEENTKS